MGSKIIEIFNKIAYNVLSALYQPFWAAVLLAFLTMFLYLYGKEHGWKKNNFIRNMFATWWRTFKNSSTFRRIFRNRQIIMRSDIKLPQLFASWSNSL